MSFLLNFRTNSRKLRWTFGTHALTAILLCFAIGSAVSPVLAQKASLDDYPGLAIPETVRVIPNIEYAAYGKQHLLLDLYLPKKSAHPLPGIVVVRGGGWKRGDKQGFALFAANLAAAGFVTACIEYRVFSQVTFPEPIYDVKAAVRWMRAEGPQYGATPNAIGAFGASAGGHLVTMLGTSADISGLEGNGGHAGVSSRVQAVFALAPIVDLSAYKPIAPLLREHPEFAEQMSPITYVSKTSAPLLLLHGNQDNTVDYSQSQEMLQRYKNAGATASLVTVDGADHSYWHLYPQDVDTVRQAAQFFHSVLDPLVSTR